MRPIDCNLQAPAPAWPRRRQLLQATAAAPWVLAGLGNQALAQQAYPNKAIKFVVPVPPGGPLELVGRHVAQRIQSQMGQPLIFEHRPGASLQVAATYVARAPADGYTLLLGNDTPFSILPALNNPLQFNPDTDFVALSLLCQASLLLVTSAGFPASNLQELLAYVKANPGKASYASPGVGSQHHIAMERFLGRAGVEMLHVPYAGIAPAFNSLLAGDTQILFAALTLPTPHIKSGRVKALAYTGSKRHPSLPNVPTFMESGVPDYTISAWFGVFAPAGTPQDVSRRLSSVFWEAASSKEFTDNVLIPIGFEPNPSVPPEQFPAFLREDRRKWREAVQRIDPKRLAG